MTIYKRTAYDKFKVLLIFVLATSCLIAFLRFFNPQPWALKVILAIPLLWLTYQTLTMTLYVFSVKYFVNDSGITIKNCFDIKENIEWRNIEFKRIYEKDSTTVCIDLFVRARKEPLILNRSDIQNYEEFLKEVLDRLHEIPEK